MMRYLSSGKLLDVEFRTCCDDSRYYIRFAAMPRAAALLYALGRMEFEVIGPQQDAGRMWYQVEIDNALLDLLRESVDGVSTVIFNLPAFGQMTLFDK